MLPGSTGAAGAQAADGAQPQAGTTTTGQAPAAGSGQAPAADGGSGTGTNGAATGATTPPTETAEQRADRLEAELAETRREAAGHRTRAQALEREKGERDQASMTEAEKAEARRLALEDENKALKASLQDQLVEGATLSAATKLNYRNPELAYRLLDRSALEYEDGTGRPKNVEKLLRELAQREPYLVRAATGSDFGGGAQGGTPSTEPGMNELLRAVRKG